MTKKALGLDEFNQLAQDQQLNILHMNGVFVGKRKLDRQTVVLFQLYGFYVEVFYTHYRKTVERTVTSADANILQPYLNQIQVKGLDKNSDGTE